MDKEKLRFFERLIRLFGLEAYKRLEAAHVAVVGIGGVGSWACEALARSAVGRITLVDFDYVNPSNLNRQLPCLYKTVGRSKAKVMAERLQEINPWAHVEWLNMVYTPTTAPDFWNLNPQFVLDCIDNVTYKCHLLNYAREHAIPIVTSTGAGGRWDPTCIKVCDLSHTKIDPMALRVRKKLRRDYSFPANKSFHIPAVYSEEEPVKPFELELEEAEAVPSEADYEDADVYEDVQKFSTGKGRHAPTCGTSSFVTGAFGLVAAQQIVKLIINK